MAESKSKSKSKSRSKSKRSGGSKSKGSSSGRKQRKDLSPRDVALNAASQFQELTGRPVEALTGMERNGREWTLTVEVVELARIPNTTDVLGKYELTTDKEGELIGARRTRRYNRGEAGED
jgi:hypothetical protein